ncbi:MAG: ThaI family type II restriction endonuclease [Archaeoglobaceae archaeon]|nr:ThaI family type II restriction endonuclease [Archaeoglobaceae archaeon]MDW8118240.1 ThaI family type II restriction endonuclease [Archaeoglobaceae archaeon]
MDPLIELLKRKNKIVELLGRFWEILYIEGSTPDIGKRREHIIRTLLEVEFGLKVIPAPPMERGWDFQVIFDNQKSGFYSLKTTENITTIKVAWNGFPSIERARKFEFKYPILYITANRDIKEISVYVFDVEDLNNLKNEIGDDMWWIPKSGTNPRGFGINTRSLKSLIIKAEKKGNAITERYKAVDIARLEKEYWRKWYLLLKELALKHV